MLGSREELCLGDAKKDEPMPQDVDLSSSALVPLQWSLTMASMVQLVARSARGMIVGLAQAQKELLTPQRKEAGRCWKRLKRSRVVHTPSIVEISW